jgi:hypothetical protein
MSRPKANKANTSFDKRWLEKSLESLEKETWETPDESSYLITTCHALRKKQLKQFEIEDLRIMIGQDIGLKYLIPLAMQELEKNILAEGDFYKGDLLNAVLNSEVEFWKEEQVLWNQMCELFEENRAVVKNEASMYDTGRQILKSFQQFSEIHT